MSGIGRIGMMGGVNRDSASAGHETVAKEMDRQLSMLETPGAASGTAGDAQTKIDAFNAKLKNAEIKHPVAKNKKVDEVAKLYEKQFLGEMVKAMRSTVSFSDKSKPSMAENIYSEQLDQQYVDAWGEDGGIGLSNVIYDQMMERYFDKGASQSLRKQGPIKLTDRDVAHVSRVQNAVENSQQIPLKIDLKPGADLGANQIKAPWSGEVVSKMRVGEKSAVTLKHDGGVRSTFIFDGVASSGMEPGRQFDKDATVGVLSPEINSFFWNLHRSAESPAKLDSPASGDLDRGRVDLPQRN